MTLISTLLVALYSFFGMSGAFEVTKLDPWDINKRENQAPFHEEDMLRAGQSGHCPHG
jgi:hypothetical protein